MIIEARPEPLIGSTPFQPAHLLDEDEVDTLVAQAEGDEDDGDEDDEDDEGAEDEA